LSFKVTSNVDELRAKLAGLGAGIGAILRRPRLQAAVQSHMTKVTNATIRKLGALGDSPAKGTYRGVTWEGFATWRTKKYGMEVPEGTRFYWRGRRKSQGAKSLKAGAKRSGIAGFSGPVKMEKVWRKRASGRKYSPSSKLLQDTGRLRGFTHHTKHRVTGSGRRTSLVLTAGQQVEYFGMQHEMRPIWFVHQQTDGPAIAAIISREVDILAREARR